MSQKLKDFQILKDRKIIKFKKKNKNRKRYKVFSKTSDKDSVNSKCNIKQIVAEHFLSG